MPQVSDTRVVAYEPLLSPVVYGRSVTDACMDIGTTERVLSMLAGAVSRRRDRVAPQA